MKTNHKLIVRILIFSMVCIYPLRAFPSSQESALVMAKKYLPANSSIENLISVNPLTNAQRSTPAVKMGRCEGHNAFLAFIYNEADDHHALKLRIILNPESQPVMLDRGLPGGFLWMQEFETIGFKVLDLNQDGIDDIVTITSDGGSLGAYLNVFTIRRNQIESLINKEDGQELGGYKFVFERRQSAPYRIVVYEKWTERDNSTVSIYEWNGHTFAVSLADTSRYYDEAIRPMIKKIYSKEPNPASWRAGLALQVSGIYIQQGHYAEAVRLCEDTLKMIDDPSVTTLPAPAVSKTMTPMERDRIIAWWGANKLKDKAAIHTLLGDAYKGAGDISKAETHRKEAEELNREAKEQLSTVPR
jgi:tetratricopeptide (TPR) repeat protein